MNLDLKGLDLSICLDGLSKVSKAGSGINSKEMEQINILVRLLMVALAKNVVRGDL